MAAQSQVMRARLHLIGELHAGLRAPGAAISVKETAASLNLSPTPVREALARLTGEGLVAATEDRNGFAVPRLGPGDLVEAIEFVRLLLDAATKPYQIRLEKVPECALSMAREDAVSVTEGLLSWLTGRCDNSRIVQAIGITGVMLAPYRRIEPMVLPHWSAEIIELRDAIATGRSEEALKNYWQVRIDNAVALTAAVDRSHRDANIFRI